MVRGVGFEEVHLAAAEHARIRRVDAKSHSGGHDDEQEQGRQESEHARGRSVARGRGSDDAPPVWLAIDGGYAKRPVLRAARAQQVRGVGRLPRNAALRSLPSAVRPPGKRGPMPTYGKDKISLVKRAGQRRGWQRLRCRQYGQERTKTVKTFLAT